MAEIFASEFYNSSDTSLLKICHATYLFPLCGCKYKTSHSRLNTKVEAKIFLSSHGKLV